MSYREQSREDLLARIKDLEEELERLRNPPQKRTPHNTRMPMTEFQETCRILGIDIQNINPFDYNPPMFRDHQTERKNTYRPWLSASYDVKTGETRYDFLPEKVPWPLK